MYSTSLPESWKMHIMYVYKYVTIPHPTSLSSQSPKWFQVRLSTRVDQSQHLTSLLDHGRLVPTFLPGTGRIASKRENPKMFFKSNPSESTDQAIGKVSTRSGTLHTQSTRRGVTAAHC